MKLKLTIAYDGSFFAGWQSQCHGNTVQDTLERAFTQIAGGRIIVYGASRTDAGVHAIGQVAHVDLGEVSQKMSSPKRWQIALNASLPPQVRILRAERISEQFHARFSAHSKIYRYCLWHEDILPPLLYQRAWQIHGPLNIALMSSMANALVGTHDFRGFTARSGSKRENTIRTLYCVKVLKRGKEVQLIFHGNGFLYHMVRMLVGAMVHVARGTLLREEFVQRLTAATPSIAPRSAPAAGLYLTRVLYQKK